MAVLYSNNFDAEANGALAGWAASQGSAFTVFAINSAQGAPVQGTKHFGERSEGDSVRWETGGSLTDQAVRMAQRWVTGVTSSVAAYLRVHPTLGDRGVLMLYQESGGNLRGSIIVRDNGTVTQAQSAYNVPVSNGDIVHLEASAVGNNYELRVWTNSNARPSTATISHTSSVWANGRVGLRKTGATFEYAACDNLVITDAAGGEDFFYPTFNFTGSVALDAVGTSGTFQGVAAGAFAGAITLDDAAPTGSFGASSGTLVSEPLRTNNGTLLASTALAHVAIYNDTTGALVLRRTSISTDSAGVFTITDPTIVAGVTYRIDWETSGGHRRMPRKLAA